MNFFRVYTHASGKVEYARDGFNISAFLFVLFFTMYKGLWLLSLVVFCASGISYTLYSTQVITLPYYLIIELLIKLYVGFSYSDWLYKKLKKKKYKLADIVLAQGTMHAKLKFMKRQNKASRKQTRNSSLALESLD
ncbi:DUF2628 domain-containing protein [Candidatus Anaplasma sp. TIGMIC]|uniref:Erum7620/ECH_0207 family putative T1SS effector n=1 Tax=Candidatus Anaplasma sp. TIGMIC TaxID=3020713 RepID=UPI00232D754E|nr:DUF2628 domain-containing protein [Candidatus Anaplasma sp. TIGMIC]MDB1135582.1 hypothetical protein [Candidatus Anaplasma sp. TIGMIC]